MRLLGAGSAATSGAKDADADSTKAEIKRRDRELEKQFDQGLAMKEQRRRGLGA